MIIVKISYWFIMGILVLLFVVSLMSGYAIDVSRDYVLAVDPAVSNRTPILYYRSKMCIYNVMEYAEIKGYVFGQTPDHPNQFFIATPTGEVSFSDRKSW